LRGRGTAFASLARKPILSHFPDEQHPAFRGYRRRRQLATLRAKSIRRRAGENPRHLLIGYAVTPLRCLCGKPEKKRPACSAGLFRINYKSSINLFFTVSLAVPAVVG
jgi:hypothetical protein